MNESGSSPERRIYRNPPIAEAIVELVFAGGSAWGLTVPGRIFDLVKNDYPNEPEQREVAQATLGSPAPGEAIIALNTEAKRVLFRDDNQLMMVGPNVLSVHGVKPYEGWGSLRRRILKALAVYRDVLSPDTVTRIGLRYINRIEIPESTVNFLDYFTVAQGLPPNGFPANLRSFFDRMELAYDDIPATIAFTWASSVGDREGVSTFVVDLDLHWNESFSFENVIDHIDELRSRERLAFESLIQDRLRDVFDADEDS